MALVQQGDDKSIERTIANELSQADKEMAERREKVKLKPPRVLVVFVVDGIVQTSIELPPFVVSEIYDSQIKTYRSGHLESGGLNYHVHVSGNTFDYHIEKESKE